MTSQTHPQEVAGLVVEAAREALFHAEVARTDVVNPVNGSVPYSYVKFHGQRVCFYDGELDTMQERDACTSKAAAYADAINNGLFDLAKRAAQIALTKAAPPVEGDLRAFIEGWNQACISITPGSGFHPEDRAQAWREFAALQQSRSTPGVASIDKCALCDFERKEHDYNGACYGICGEFVVPTPAPVAGNALDAGTALEALKPFAEAADNLDDAHNDRFDIWESGAAMSITAGDLRRAAKAYAATLQSHGQSAGKGVEPLDASREGREG